MNKILAITILAFALIGCAATKQKDRQAWLVYFFDGVPTATDMENGVGKTPVAIHLKTEKVAMLVKHPPYADGDCTICHDFNGSKLKFFLTDPLPTLCLNCHAEEETEFKHFPLDNGKYDCTNCHNPHESKEKFFLRTTPNDLCVTCHDQTTPKMQAMLKRNEVTEEKCLDCHSYPHNPLDK